MIINNPTKDEINKVLLYLQQQLKQLQQQIDALKKAKEKK